MKKLLMAFAVAMTLATPSVASDYTQKCNIFGCVNTYTGPRTSAAVDQYIRDAKDALQAVMDKNPSIVNAEFNVRHATLVFTVSNPATFKRSELLDAMREFKSRHVNIENGIAMSRSGFVVKHSDWWSGDFEGWSRYRALKTVKSVKFW